MTIKWSSLRTNLSFESQSETEIFASAARAEIRTRSAISVFTATMILLRSRITNGLSAVDPRGVRPAFARILGAVRVIPPPFAG